MSFKMKFDNKTIDHLGIKLYSSFPPVIAELISNSYDAEATKVDIIINYKNKTVRVVDNGHGMTHDELNNNFLVIGKNRRETLQGGFSKNGKRKVTGKKGLGKLAVFGIAEDIEIMSICNNKMNSFSMNYSKIKSSTQEMYEPEVINENVESNKENGTSVIIKNITQKNITSIPDLLKSLSRRFSFYDDDFKVSIKDENTGEEVFVEKNIYFENLEEQFKWVFPDDFLNDNTKEIKYLKDKGVTGKVFTKKTPLKSSEAGFILYARKKLASENTFFNDRSNDHFNGYVTGYFNVDYIDDDNITDNIVTARQSLLWDKNNDTENLKESLNKLINMISLDWRKKRKNAQEKQISELIDENFYEGLTKQEIENMKKIQKILITNSENEEKTIIEVLTSVRTAYEFNSFKEYVNNLNNEEITLENMSRIANDWEQIEAKELAKVALGRIEAIKTFEKYIYEDASETKYIQPFLEKFPWILDPRITSFEREVYFSTILKKMYPDNKLKEANKRIDFLCNLVNGELIIIELKRPNIKISEKEITQALSYKIFIEKNHKDAIKNGVKTYLISDRYDMEEVVRVSVRAHEQAGTLYIRSYSDLLSQAKQYNKEFINQYDKLQEKIKK